MPDINPIPSPSGEAFKLPVNPGNGNGNGQKNTAASFLAKLMGKGIEVVPTGTPSGAPLSNLPSFSTAGSLGAKPFTRAKIEEFSQQRKLKIAKVTFWGITVATVLGLAYFMVQLNPDFTLIGDTMAKQYQESRQKIVSKQTEINENRLRLAQLNIDRVNFLADAFLVNLEQSESKVISPGERQKAKDKVVASRQLILESMESAKNALKNPFDFPLPDLGAQKEGQKDPFEASLLASLQSKETAARQKKNTDLTEARFISNMGILFQNKTFRNYLQKLDVDSPDDIQLKEAIGKIRDLAKDDTALIAKVKADRVRWTEVIDHINTLTKEIDPLYGKDRLFEEIGGIRYSNYAFDQTHRKISVSGEVKTPVSDSKTFSLIARLIEKFESSPYFKNVEMRDFSKSFSEKEGFVSSLKFDMSLQ